MQCLGLNQSSAVLRVKSVERSALGLISRVKSLGLNQSRAVFRAKSVEGCGNLSSLEVTVEWI